MITSILFTIQNMAQLDDMQRNGGTPRTVEQILNSENPKSWDTSAVIGRVDDPEDEYLHHGKKLSVIAKVKEKAKKWRQTLAKKKSGHDGNTTPSWGVALEDYEVEDDSENLGSQAYDDSQNATKNTRQNYRTEPLITDKRLFSSDVVQTHSDNMGSPQKLPPALLKMNRTGPALGKTHSGNQGEKSPLCGIRNSPRAQSRFMLDTLTDDDQSNNNYDKQKDKLLGGPEVVVTNEVVVIEKSSAKKDDGEEERPLHNNATTEEQQEQQSPPTTKKTITESVSEKLGPAYATVSEATYKITSKIQGMYYIGNNHHLHGTGEEREWDKGISVKDYFKNKLEPGEDEKALSQVISEVISPKRTPTDKSVVEKVRAAVTLLLQSEEEEPSSSSSSKKRSSSHIPLSTNAHEVEEENNQQMNQQAY